MMGRRRKRHKRGEGGGAEKEVAKGVKEEK